MNRTIQDSYGGFDRVNNEYEQVDFKRLKSEPSRKGIMNGVSKNHSSNTTTTTTSADCYNDVISSETFLINNSITESTTITDYTSECGETMANNNNNNNIHIRSSWLNNLEWISHNNTESINDDKKRITCDEIRQLAQQLAQVKRRLNPTAEQTAQAYNTMRMANKQKKTDSRHEFEKARNACNPYEILSEGRNRNSLNHKLFMNRSAIKLANIDAILNFILTEKKMDNNDSNNTFIFVDLCGAPGGFSEYIMWRWQQQQQQQQQRHNNNHSTIKICRGYGMSLNGNNEQGKGLQWKLNDFSHTYNNNNNNNYGNNTTISTNYRICHGIDGTGDIYKPENINYLQQMITHDATLDVTTNVDEVKAHLVVADGGIDAQRDVENQEEIAQKLIVCETGAALSVLQTGGIFIIKMFGFQTETIRSIIRHLYISFDSIMIIKPISSRPASAERYVVCYCYHGQPAGWNVQDWYNQMLLGRVYSYTNTSSILNFEQHEKRLYQYIDEIDRNIYALNLKVCFNILSYLQRKTIEYKSQQEHTEEEIDSMVMDDDDDETFEYSTLTFSSTENHQVHVPSYRHAWRLTNTNYN